MLEVIIMVRDKIICEPHKFMFLYGHGCLSIDLISEHKIKNYHKTLKIKNII